jgi:hypothetical protein
MLLSASFILMNVLTLLTTNQKEKKMSSKFGSHKYDFETPEQDNIMAQNTVTVKTSVALLPTSKQGLESPCFVSINVRDVYGSSVTDITHLTSLKSVLS